MAISRGFEHLANIKLTLALARHTRKHIIMKGRSLIKKKSSVVSNIETFFNV